MCVTYAASPLPFCHPPSHSAAYMLTAAPDNSAICLFSIGRCHICVNTRALGRA